MLVLLGDALSRIYHQNADLGAFNCQLCAHNAVTLYLVLHPALTPDTRSSFSRGAGAQGAALTRNEIELVKSHCDHILDEEELRIEHGMGVIATVVALAPMLGLLGTVWGVLDAFADMGAAGSATIATMAPAISSALVTTVVGLLIAIPGVCAYNRLNATVRGLIADMEGFADDLVGRIALEFQA